MKGLGHSCPRAHPLTLAAPLGQESGEKEDRSTERKETGAEGSWTGQNSHEIFEHVSKRVGELSGSSQGEIS